MKDFAESWCVEKQALFQEERFSPMLHVQIYRYLIFLFFIFKQKQESAIRQIFCFPESSSRCFHVWGFFFPPLFEGKFLSCL